MKKEKEVFLVRYLIACKRKHFPIKYRPLRETKQHIGNDSEESA